MHACRTNSQVSLSIDRINGRVRFVLSSVLCDSFEASVLCDSNFEASVRKSNGCTDGRSEGERAFQR